MATITQVQRRVHTNGLRAADRAVIQEELAALVVPVAVDAPVMKWVVEAFLCDGDKWWLDTYEVVLITDSFEEADALCSSWDARDTFTTDERPAPKTRLEFRDVSKCYDCQYWLKYRVQPSRD